MPEIGLPNTGLIDRDVVTSGGDRQRNPRYNNDSSGFSASEAVAGWMNSEARRASLLTKQFAPPGVAVYSKDGGNYWVEVFAPKLRDVHKEKII